MADSSQVRGARVRLRLTVAGWIYLVIAGVVCVAAVKSQAAMLFVMFGGMIGGILVSVMLARRMLSGVEMGRDVPDQVWQNQTVHLGYYLCNRRKRGSCIGISVEEAHPEGIETARGYCTHLPAGATFRAGGRFVVRKRGRIRLKGAEVGTIFPFGLLAASRAIPLPRSLVVWPARGQLKRMLLRRGAMETSSAAPSRATGGQDEFFGLRDYRADDNPRWIHWRRSALRASPVVREMCHPLPEALMIVLDTHLGDVSQESLHRRERMIRFAGTLVHYAFAKGYQVGMALPCDAKVAIFPPASGIGQQRQILDALADIGLNTTQPLEGTLRMLKRGLLRDCQLVVLTMKAGRIDRAALAPVRAACREFSLVGEDELKEVFEDDPLAASEKP
jgi:uncharacterized protein (DUF58 family)